MKDSGITINGHNFPLSYKILEGLALALPPDGSAGDIARAILELNVPSLTENLIKSGALGMDELDGLWEKGDLHLKRLLAEQPDFWLHLSNAQAKEIIDLDDAAILLGLCRWAELLDEDSDEEADGRLSEGMADTLLEMVSTHPNPAVRLALLENTLAPEEYAPKFRDFVKSGVYPDEESNWLALLEEEDIPFLTNTPLAMLKQIAENLEAIEDRKTRGKAAKFLAAHADLGVRLALAENRATPAACLKELAADAEPDVAHAARETMKG